MTITIKALLTAPLLDSTFAAVDIADVRGNVYDGLTVVGFSDTVTLTGRTVSFNPSGTFSIDKLYQVELAKTTGGEVLTTRDWVWIRAASGEFLAGDPNEISDFQTYKQGFPALERSTTDTAIIEFYWKNSGATFANSASTCKRIFLGETGSQEEALSGSITAISGRSGWYKIAYNVADRAADGATVVPTSVTYTLVDDNGNTGFLTLVIVEFATAVQGGTTFDQAPVTPTGRLRQIIIGDDYLAANGRSFIWTVPAVSGFVASAVEARFGATGVFACGAYSFLVSKVGVTDNGNGTWTVSVDLPGSSTESLVPGDYDWSMTLSSGGVNITKIQNSTPTDKVKILGSPS